MTTLYRDMEKIIKKDILHAVLEDIRDWSERGASCNDFSDKMANYYRCQSLICFLYGIRVLNMKKVDLLKTICMNKIRI